MTQGDFNKHKTDDNQVTQNNTKQKIFKVHNKVHQTGKNWKQYAKFKTTNV